jgi:acyl carrier protein
MNPGDKSKLQGFLRECLSAAGDQQEMADDSSLFVSGRLDSLAMTRLVVFLEESFGIDFGEVAFDVDLVDSVDAIEALVEGTPARRV